MQQQQQQQQHEFTLNFVIPLYCVFAFYFSPGRQLAKILVQNAVYDRAHKRTYWGAYNLHTVARKSKGWRERNGS